MYAERLILGTDVSGQLMQMPKLPPNKQVEAIFLVIADNVISAGVRRSPHSAIAGKTQIIGEVFDSAPVAHLHYPKGSEWCYENHA